jgi:hypothetical protein
MSEEKKIMDPVLSFSLRGAIGFGIGGVLVALAELSFFISSYEAAPPIYYIFFAYFLCGALGAIILTWGPEPSFGRAAGFGCGFVITACMVFFTMLSLQASAGPEYAWGAAGCGIGFAVGGGLGGLCIGPRFAIPAALSFGVSGALWGLMIFWAVGERGEAPLPSAAAGLVSILAIALPFLIGGALFGAVAGFMSKED